jgi:hypothetical protein
MMINVRQAAGALAAALAALAAASGASAASSHERSSHFQTEKPINRVVIDLEAGQVTLHLETTTQSRVTMTTRWSFDDPPRLRETIRGRTLYLTSRCGTRYACGTYYAATLPAGIAVAISGRVASASITGTARTIAVWIRVGYIDLDLARPPRRIRASTKAGPIHISVPRGAYRIDADTEHGDEDESGIRRKASAIHAIYVRSGAGDIRIVGT